MTWSDVFLLARKIAVGILVFLVPLVLIAGAIWLTWRSLIVHQP